MQEISDILSPGKKLSTDGASRRRRCGYGGPGQRPEQGNAPLWLLSPHRAPLCRVPSPARNDRGGRCHRAPARTPAAIRFPAEKPGKLALLRANSQPLSYSPKVLLSAMPCRKENGLSRRFAPRNDRGGRPCEPVQDGNRGAPVRPGEGDAAE